MKQEVTLKKWYPSSYHQLQIHAVYQKGEELIVISQRVNHATSTRNGIIVDTNANIHLPISTVIITDHPQGNTIPEIKDLIPLPIYASSPSQKGSFFNAELNVEESNYTSSQNSHP